MVVKLFVLVIVSDKAYDIMANQTWKEVCWEASGMFFFASKKIDKEFQFLMELPASGLLIMH